MRFALGVLRFALGVQRFALSVSRFALSVSRKIRIFIQTNSMANKISEGVEIDVETFYQPDYSNPVAGEHMFAYRITIWNHNNFPVKLHRRQWHIFDSNGSNREVEGE